MIKQQRHLWFLSLSFKLSISTMNLGCFSHWFLLLNESFSFVLWGLRHFFWFNFVPVQLFSAFHRFFRCASLAWVFESRTTWWLYSQILWLFWKVQVQGFNQFPFALKFLQRFLASGSYDSEQDTDTRLCHVYMT